MSFKARKNFMSLSIIFMIMIVWLMVFTTDGDLSKQYKLYNEAKQNIEKEIYISSVPLLEEAISYNTDKTKEIEEVTKEVYLKLKEQREYERKYIALCELQMSRDNVQDDIYIELFNYYKNKNKYIDSINVLVKGVEKNKSEQLINLLEKNKYEYSLGTYSYEDAKKTFGKYSITKTNGKWGLSERDGSPVIPGQFSKMSTFNEDRSIVQKDGEIYSVDKNNNRLSVYSLSYEISDFGNYSENRLPVLINGKWRNADGDLNIGSKQYDELKTYFDGHVAVKINGKWGVINKKEEFLIQPIYDEIALDELDICYRQSCSFVKDGTKYYLFKDGEKLENSYDGAKVFNETGYGAVKQGGKWGFINTDGEVVINYKFDDALSFSYNLAAVKVGDLWGYINVYGDVVIEPQFLNAKEFSNGYAQVLTENGYRFLSLKYK